MKKFVLIEVVEREISTPEFFDTYEEAYAEMEARWDSCSEDGEIESFFAYGETENHDNIDWRIFEISNEELVDKIASFFEKENNWKVLMRNCWLENGRSDDLRSMLREAMK